MTSTNKISLEPAFVLHRRPYQETSIIADFFTRKYGRINAVAKGAKRPKSPLRSVLSPASKLSISFSGKNDLKTLSSAEILNHYILNSSQSLNSIVYINELLTKAIEKEDTKKEDHTPAQDTVKGKGSSKDKKPLVKYEETDSPLYAQVKKLLRNK